MNIDELIVWVNKMLSQMDVDDFSEDSIALHSILIFLMHAKDNET